MGPGGGVGLGVCFGTFGELLQGVLPDGRDFLVTFPIAAWSRATFRLSGDEHIRVIPARKRKSLAVARLVVAASGHRVGGTLELTSDLPEGKGLASSSADLVATARAVVAALGGRIDEVRLESFLRQIEPSDGVMYRGVVAFHHREVRLRRWLGLLPPLSIVAHDEGGQLDTIRYNRVRKRFTEDDRHEYGRLLDALAEAVRGGDVRSVGGIAGRSAELNAKQRARPGLAVLRRACAEVDGLGLVLAHSGTVCGILLPAEDHELGRKVAHVRTMCRSIPGTVAAYRSLGPGDDWEPSIDHQENPCKVLRR